MFLTLKSFTCDDPNFACFSSLKSFTFVSRYKYNFTCFNSFGKLYMWLATITKRQHVISKDKERNDQTTTRLFIVVRLQGPHLSLPYVHAPSIQLESFKHYQQTPSRWRNLSHVAYTLSGTKLNTEF